MVRHQSIPTQVKLNYSIDQLPVEYFKWGSYPDHFKIDMPHRHEFMEILFFTKGGGTHEINFLEHDIEYYSVHFIPSSIVHFLKRDTTSDGFTIAYQPEFLEHNPFHRIISPMSDRSFVLNLTKEKFQKINILTEVVRDHMSSNNSYYKEKCFLLSLELLLNNIANEQNIDIQQNNNKHQKDNLYTSFIQLVKSNIHRQCSVTWYACQLSISPKYLSNHLTKRTGKSAKAIITEEFLISIKKSLLNTNKSIKEIALDHNYTESKLCRLFKNSVGYTMSEYRS